MFFSHKFEWKYVLHLKSSKINSYSRIKKGQNMQFKLNFNLLLALPYIIKAVTPGKAVWPVLQ